MIKVRSILFFISFLVVAASSAGLTLSNTNNLIQSVSVGGLIFGAMSVFYLGIREF